MPMPSVMRLWIQEKTAKVYLKVFHSYTEHVAPQSGFKTLVKLGLVSFTAGAVQL